MAIKCVKREWDSTVSGNYRYTFVMDSAADAAELPACATGSTAIVADKDGPIYMVNAAGEWKEL